MASSSKAALIAAVVADVERGIFSTPLRGKAAFRSGWPSEKLLDRAAIEQAYRAPGVTGRGLVLGKMSGGLDDADLDSPEAMEHAPRYLRPTRTFGHDGKITHYLYYRASEGPPLKVLKFCDPLKDGKEKEHTIVELLRDGEQAMAPPSVHPDTGAEVVWSGEAEITRAEVADTEVRVSALAADVLLGRYWPPGNSSECHDAMLALIGMLVRADWHQATVAEYIVRAAVTVGCDKTEGDLRALVAHTFKQRGEEKAFTSGTRLSEMLGASGAVIVAKVKEWLGIRGEGAEADHGSIENVLAYEAKPPVGIDPATYYGIAGIYVRSILPFTEASPIAALVTFLTAMGALFGNHVRTEIGLQVHYANLNCLLEGDTSLARKGTAVDDFERMILFPLLGQGGIDKFILRTVGSGDGLIYQVRDAGTKLDAEGKPFDPGVADKRKLVVESEFSKTLKDCGYGAAGLSSTICQAFDHKTLQRNYSGRDIKKTPLCATNPHIGILGSIQPDLLRKYLAVEEAASGFGNRFAVFHVERSKLLPKLPPLPAGLFKPIRAYLKMVLDWVATVVQPINLDAEAEALWDAWYRDRDKAGVKGLAGSLAGRAPAHVRRFALVYAALDCSSCIRRVHLEAALALWDYAERTLVYVYGDQTGDKDAQDILAGIRESKSKNREQIFAMFGRHFNAGRLNAALSRLIRDGQIIHTKGESTGGRRPDVYTPAPAAQLESKTYPVLEPDLEELEDYNLTLEHLLRDDPAEPNQGLVRTDGLLPGLLASRCQPVPILVPRYLRNHPDYWKALCDLDAPAEY